MIQRRGGKREARSDRMEAIDRRLHITRRARLEGQAELPPSGSAEPSEIELDIHAAILAEREQLEQESAILVEVLERDLRRLSPSAAQSEALFADAAAQIRRVEGRFGPAFTALLTKQRTAARELEAFRAGHALHRQPSYPDSTLLQAALLVLAAACEAAFSATLFASASDSGLLGGAATALGLSGANVSLGFLAGFLGLRYVQHRAWIMRTAGAVVAACAASAAIALNAFAALWRERLHGPITPLDSLDSANLLGLTQPEAVILLMLGLAVWVFSALKGYSGFDDPYPDFGKRDRAARQSEADLSQAREALREALEAPILALEARSLADLAAQEQALVTMRVVYDRAADGLADIAAQHRRLSDLGTELIKRYREENLGSRKSTPPSFFLDSPAFAYRPEDPLHRAAQALQTAKSETEEAQRQVARAVQELGGVLEAASARLEPPAP